MANLKFIKTFSYLILELNLFLAYLKKLKIDGPLQINFCLWFDIGVKCFIYFPMFLIAPALFIEKTIFSPH